MGAGATRSSAGSAAEQGTISLAEVSRGSAGSAHAEATRSSALFLEAVRSSAVSVKGAKSSTTVACTTFSDPLLRRGMDVSKVLRCFGAILENRDGSAHTFALSTPVQRLDVFISHNWSTRRRPKFLALAFHFNLQRAVLATLVAVSCSGTLTMLGLLPLMETSSLRVYPLTAAYCTVLCYVIPVTVLVCGHDLAALLERTCPSSTRKRVFLDKACIHQTDPILQREGIHCLSAYLNVADEMLIVYTNTYLKRLWTVYELASMLMIKQVPRITLVSTHLTQLVCVAWTIHFIFLLIQVITGSKAVGELAGEELGRVVESIMWYGSMLLLMVLVCIGARMWGRERKNMHEAALSFSIRSTDCFVNDDREVLQRNVACFMRDFGFVPQRATMDQALDAFDLTTRRLVPLFLHASFGVVGMQYYHLVVIMLPLVGWGFDVVFANARDGLPLTWYVANGLYYCGSAFVLAPLWCALSMCLASRFLGLNKIGEAAYMIAVSIFVVASGALLDAAYLMLYYAAEASWPGVIAFVLATAALGVVDVRLFRLQPVPSTARENCKSAVVDSPHMPHIVHTEI